MAATYKLVMNFTNAGGSSVTHSYRYAEPNITADDVKRLMTAIISNKEIFSNPPVSLKSAKLVATTETEYAVSE